MNALTMGAIWAGAAVGILVILAGLRGHRLLPERTRPTQPRSESQRTTAVVIGAVVAGVVVYGITGWPVAGLAVAGTALVAPRLVGARERRANNIARTEAIATWTELIRDNMAGAAGLEQALMASVGVCPVAIATEVGRFGRRLEHEPLGDALAALGDDLDHPSADLVVAALANAARMEGRDVGALLSRLAESIRADVRMRLRVEVGRARIRTSARIVIAVTGFTMVFLYLSAPSLLEAYDSLAGQVWLAVVFAIFALGLWLMDTYSQIEMPQRFSARRRSASTDRSGR